MKSCTHESTHDVADSVRCYSGSVAVEPLTHENRAAHGNTSSVEECDHCGAHRMVNSNQRHVEVSPWGPDRATRERCEREAADKERERVEASEDLIVAARGARIVGVRQRSGYHTMVDLTIAGAPRSVPLWQIQEAASQVDDGDGLVPFYRGLLRAIKRINV